MNKQEFLAALRKGLAGLPPEDIDKSVEYYGEMLDDRMEEGLTEEEAVLAIGPVEEIVSQILSETSLPKLVRAKVRPDRAWRAWEILLLVLGSPLWLVLLAAAAITISAAYIVIWSLVISLYAVDLSLAACGAAGVFASLAYIVSGRAAEGALFIGAGLVCAGTAVLLFFVSNQVTKGILLLSKKILLAMKACFIRKGDVQ